MSMAAKQQKQEWTVIIAYDLNAVGNLRHLGRFGLFLCSLVCISQFTSENTNSTRTIFMF